MIRFYALYASSLIGIFTNVFAQAQDLQPILKSAIPAQSNTLNAFVPKGWKIEEKVEGDLNGDSIPDYALKLVENKNAKTKDGDTVDRARALVIVLQSGAKFAQAGVADKLLQSTGSGGALYGAVDAPAKVSIKKSVIIVEEEHGSREVSNLIFRFRLDPVSRKFILIGFDYAGQDRAAGANTSESTNYLTGKRETIRGGKKTVATIAKIHLNLDDLDYQKFEDKVLKRLGLD